MVSFYQFGHSGRKRFSKREAVQNEPRENERTEVNTCTRPGKRLHNYYGKSPFLMGKSAINGYNHHF